MSTITATCPNCAMQYQLTDEQLSVADGQVRCGACMTVFTAIEKPEALAPENEADSFDDDALINDAPEEQPLSDDMLSESFKNLSSNNGDFFVDEIEDTNEEVEIEADEDWAEQLLAEADDDTPKNEPETPEKKPDVEVISDSFDNIDFNARDKTELIDRITPEPLEFSLAKHSGLWINLGLAFASIFLVLVLMLQWFAFQFDDIATNPKYRSLSASICKVAGCTLPNPYNINDISAQHLTVKSHEIYNNSLLVDSILTNHRKTAQPFPNLELFFTDSNQKVVAARKFTPKEYLRGEMAQRTMMPGRQPIRIALELNETKAKSSGYFLQLSY